MSGSFQTLMASTSSFPITKLLSCGFADAAAGDCERLASPAAALCAQTELAASAQSNSALARLVHQLQMLIVIHFLFLACFWAAFNLSYRFP
jgi:hypothetical protein